MQTTLKYTINSQKIQYKFSSINPTNDMTHHNLFYLCTLNYFSTWTNLIYISSLQKKNQFQRVLVTVSEKPHGRPHLIPSP